MTGVPASMVAPQPKENLSYFDAPTSYSRPQQAITIPRSWTPGPGTPPLTPDGGSDFSSSERSFDSPTAEKDALDFLMTVFPKDGLNALPYSKRVAISSDGLASSFDGIVMALPGKPKTLYVDGKNAATVSLRER